MNPRTLHEVQSAAAGISPEGTLLVRPDGFVAWRSSTLPTHPERELEDALSRIIDRKSPYTRS